MAIEIKVYNRGREPEYIIEDDESYGRLQLTKEEALELLAQLTEKLK
jgi:hypothetical protein